MHRAPLAVVLVVGAVWLSFPLTLRDHPVYDAAPIVAAGRLVDDGADAFYVEPGQPGRERFIDVTCEASGLTGCREVPSFFSAPVVAVAAQSLEGMAPRDASTVIQWISVASMLALLLLLWQWLGDDAQGRAVVALTAVALSPVAAAIITLGQTTALLGIVPLVAVLHPSADRLAGVLLGVLAILKLFPVLLLGVFVHERRWKAVVANAATFLVALIVGLVTLGLDAHWRWLGAVRSHGAGVGFSPWNGSLDAVVGSAPIVATVARVVILATVVRCVRDPHVDRARAWGIATAGLIAITPQLWAHYLVAVVVAAALLVPRRLRWWVPVLAAWAAVPNWLNSLSYENGALLRWSVLAAPLAVVLLTARDLVRESHAVESPARS